MKRWAVTALAAVSYFVVARLSLLIAYDSDGALQFAAERVDVLGLLIAPQDYAVAVWPAAGIAAAAVIVFRWRAAAGVWLGHALANLPFTEAWLDALPVCLAIGAGGAAQALLAARLARYIDLRAEGSRDIVGLCVVLGPLSCVVSATVGLLALSGAGLVTWTAGLWTAWYVGDAIGGVAFGVLVLSWLRDDPVWRTRRASLTAITFAMLGLAVLVASSPEAKPYLVLLGTMVAACVLTGAALFTTGRAAQDRRALIDRIDAKDDAISRMEAAIRRFEERAG